ncbi:MAG: MaoC family dehydratase N-terminal domain-containing protein [Dehalococcoidia bacterium]|nr:MaoC family dehydratase N-terminal domain-containing protein [Dehalococcoidia bacterium]
MDKSVLGKEYPPFEFPVEKGKIREFADAIYDDNPVYRDEKYARKRGFGGIIAPPTFIMVSCFISHDQAREELDRRPGASLHGEEEFEYFQPLKAGDVLTGRMKTVKMFEKQGHRGGRMLFAVIETTFTNQKGEKVMVARETMIETEDDSVH